MIGCRLLPRLPKQRGSRRNGRQPVGGDVTRQQRHGRLRADRHDRKGTLNDGHGRTRARDARASKELWDPRRRRRARPLGTHGHGLRVPGPQRRGQDDHDAPAHRAHPPRCRVDRAPRPSIRSSRPPSPVRRRGADRVAVLLSVSVGAPEPAGAGSERRSGRSRTHRGAPGADRAP